jgi:preprotein translocase subunit SecD
VQSRLDQGGIISGNFTEQAAKTLAAQLQFGALPLPLVLESSDTVRTIAAGE